MVKGNHHTPSLLPVIDLAWACLANLATEKKEEICLGVKRRLARVFLCDKKRQKEEMSVQALIYQFVKLKDAPVKRDKPEDRLITLAEQKGR